jgi:hypothetical protein
MTGRTARTVGSAVFVLLLTSCTAAYDIQIQTPIEPKLDVAPFRAF